jgi:hypothetical protein
LWSLFSDSSNFPHVSSRLLRNGKRPGLAMHMHGELGGANFDPISLMHTELWLSQQEPFGKASAADYA